MSKKKVCIVGAGISGLSAAHELIMRGFEVSIYESTSSIGGKAKSELSADGYPCEHGFRFYVGYKNFFKTMLEIPTHHGQTVYENLTEVNVNFLYVNNSPITLRSRNRLMRPFSGLYFLYKFSSVVSLTETFHFAKEVLLLPFRSKKYLMKLQHLDFKSYITNENTHSLSYQMYIERFPQTLWGIPPEEGSAYVTINSISTLFKRYLNLFSKDIYFPMMKEPSSDALYIHWERFLIQRGVKIFYHHKISKINSQGSALKIDELVVENPETTIKINADYYLFAVPIEVLHQLLPKKFTTKIPILEELSKSTYALNGIQLYLKGHYSIINGLSRYSDSAWDLSANLENTVLWPKTKLKHPVKAVLSVAVANWGTVGVLYNKPITECSPDEIIDELVAQMGCHRTVKLTRKNIHRYHIDSCLVFSEDKSRIIANNGKLYCVRAGRPLDEPRSDTPITNLFIAGDFVATGMHNGTMESANISGKLAANEIMKRAGYLNNFCAILKNPFMK
jgi:uncharacterized protein with NAD-binding domain and iron-sulfur cluster